MIRGDDHATMLGYVLDAAKLDLPQGATQSSDHRPNDVQRPLGKHLLAIERPCVFLHRKYTVATHAKLSLRNPFSLTSRKRDTQVRIFFLADLPQAGNTFKKEILKSELILQRPFPIDELDVNSRDAVGADVPGANGGVQRDSVFLTCQTNEPSLIEI